jgi:hypothetical protein
MEIELKTYIEQVSELKKKFIDHLYISEYLIDETQNILAIYDIDWSTLVKYTSLKLDATKWNDVYGLLYKVSLKFIDSQKLIEDGKNSIALPYKMFLKNKKELLNQIKLQNISDEKVNLLTDHFDSIKPSFIKNSILKYNKVTLNEVKSKFLTFLDIQANYSLLQYVSHINSSINSTSSGSNFTTYLKKFNFFDKRLFSHFLDSNLEEYNNDYNLFLEWINENLTIILNEYATLINQEDRINYHTYNSNELLESYAILIQNIILLSTACKVVLFNSLFKSMDLNCRNFFTKNNKLKYEEITIKNRQSTKVADILNNPQAYKDKFVTICGLFSDLKIIHKGRKAISIASVSDEDGKKIPVFIPYIKVDSTGLVNGCMCTITGYWRLNSKETNFNSLQIDILSLKDLSLHDWQSFKKYYCKDIYEPITNQLNLSFEWKMGRSGAVNPIIYKKETKF